MVVNKRKFVAVVFAALLFGSALTLLLSTFVEFPWANEEEVAEATHADHAHSEGSQDSYYTCPMHPDVVSDKPGACPVCGMDLVKKVRGEGMDPRELAAIGRIALSPAQRVLANVQTATAEPMAGPSGELRAVGTVAYDETGLSTVPSWVDGRIDALLVEETGSVVEKGQPIMRIYSPDLLAAQQELIAALRSGGAFSERMADAARRKLELLGMSAGQIRQIASRKKAQPQVTVFAPNAGTVTALSVRQGQYVEQGTPLFDLADLGEVWIEAEVYEQDVARIKEGMPVRVQAEALPGESFEGRVDFIQPLTDTNSRTTKVRVELDNEDGRLKPGMFASVFFPAEGADQEAAERPRDLAVPRSAVLRTGKAALVYVEVEDNLFERREVELGPATDTHLIVRSGLRAGERVAAQGGFLLDSEVQLNTFGASGAHGHGDHGDDEHASRDESASKSNDASTSPLTLEDLAPEGEKFEPPIHVDAVPEGAWYCDMDDHAHWVQPERGDGICPECNMKLVEKGAHEAHDGHEAHEPAADEGGAE